MRMGKKKKREKKKKESQGNQRKVYLDGGRKEVGEERGIKNNQIRNEEIFEF